MTTIEIYRKNGNIIKYCANGHADYDEIGKDIVCSAISILLQSPIGGMQDVLGIFPKYEINDSGFLDVYLDNIPTNNKDKEINILLETMVIMIKELEKEYPENLKLVEKEVK